MKDLLTTAGEHLNAIRDLIARSKDVDVAVAFWGAGASDALILPAKRRGPRTRILCNLTSGATNPGEIEALMRAKCQVRTSPRLHAKIWLGSTSLIVGSANASANGLGLEGAELTRWEEVSYRIMSLDAIAAARVWFESQWESAKPVNDDILHLAWEEWRKHRDNRPLLAGKRPRNLVAAVRADVEQFRDREIYVALESEELDKRGETELAKRRESHGNAVDCWQDWNAMPKGATIIDWWYTPKDITPQGFYVTPSAEELAANTIMLTRPKSKIVFVKEVRSLHGLDLGPIKLWIKAIEAQKRKMRKPNDWCVPFFPFAEEFLLPLLQA